MNRSRLAALTAGAMFLVASVFVPATAFAAGPAMTVVSSTATPAVGGSFTVDVMAENPAGVSLAGATAGLTFNQSVLQVGWVEQGPGWGTLPNASLLSWVLPGASDVAVANASGTIASAGAFFTDGTSVAAQGNKALYRVHFFVVACGTSALTLTTPEMLDGTAASYGSPITVTATAGSVTASCAAPTQGPAVIAISGTVNPGYVALTCTTPVNMPLVRNATNVYAYSCDLGSDTTWNLTVADTKSTANKGHMTDAGETKVLKQSFHVISGATNLDLAQAATGLAAGQGSQAVAMTFSQFADPSDPAGSYGINLQFSAVGGF